MSLLLLVNALLYLPQTERAYMSVYIKAAMKKATLGERH